MVCWCKTGEEEKSKAIAVAEAQISDLQEEIEKRGAGFGRLSTEIAAMKKQISEDTAALKQATSIREGELDSFRGEERDLVQTITNLQNAIAVLSKHQDLARGLKDGGGNSFLEINGPVLSGLRVVLKDAAFKHEALSARSLRKVVLAQTAGVAKSETTPSSLLLGFLDKSSVGNSFDGLPLKFAEQYIAKSARRSPSNAHVSFLQAGSMDGQPMYQSYATRSDEIFGILSKMLEDFQSDLKSSQASDATSSSDFEALADSKNQQIEAGKAKLDELEEENAMNEKALSDAKEDLQLKSEQRSADVEFLRNLRLTCTDLDSQWEERSKTRSDELKAVSETIAILTEDDHREQLTKGGVAFLQSQQKSRATAMRLLRSKAADVLRRASQEPVFAADDLLTAWNNHKQTTASLSGPRSQLSALALTVQLDSFEQVKKALDTFVADLKDQQAEEVEFKAYCVKELDDNEKERYDRARTKKELEQELGRLDALMTALQKEISANNDQIRETQTDVKKASQNREVENAAFQTTINDQRAIQEILQKALQRLKDFYATRLTGEGPANNQLNPLKREIAENAPGRVLIQRTVQTPPAHFNDLKSNAGASPVMSLIEQIIGDSKTLEAESVAAERKAQTDYENLVKDSNALISQLKKSVVEKTEASANAKAESGASKSNLVSTVGELESLAQFEGDLHSQCDFVLKNFDVRQKARLQEITAVQQAKAIVSGASR
jgi:hypothetical protein